MRRVDLIVPARTRWLTGGPTPVTATMLRASQHSVPTCEYVLGLAQGRRVPVCLASDLYVWPQSTRQLSPDTCGLARPSLIPSLIHLRWETFGVHRTGQAAEVTDALEPPRTRINKLGKRVEASEVYPEL